MIDLFSPLGELMVTKSVLKTFWDNDNDRKELAENKLSLYKDDYEDIIKAKMQELFVKENYDRLKYHVNQSQNILKRVINTISMVYKEPATRITEDARYQEILGDCDFDSFMKRVNRYTNLFNECQVRVGVRFGKLALDILTPNNVSVIQNQLDPTIADAIYYQVSRVNTVKRGKKEDIIKYYYLDVAGNYYILNQNWDVVEVIYDADGEGLKGQEDVTPSPYVRDGQYLIPIITFHRQFPDSDFWDTTSGQDLYNSTVLTGIKFTEFDYHFKFSAFKQMYVIGDTINVPVGQIMDAPTMLWIQGEGASVGTLDTQAKLKEMQDALVFQINTIINNYGISSDAWSLSISEASGRALKIRNQALLESREDQLSTYVQGEKELFEMIKAVNNAHAKFYGWGAIGDKAEVVTDFGEIGFPEDPEVELSLSAQRLKMGLISLGQFYMQYNPDVKDEKEAEKIIIKNLTELSKTIEKTPEVDAAINAILRLKSGGGQSSEEVIE